MKQLKDPQTEAPDWKGYGIDDLRYQRALAMARLTIEKERLAVASRRIYSGQGLPGTSGMIGKILGGLNYVDYAVLAFKLGRRVYSMFHSRRG